MSLRQLQMVSVTLFLGYPALAFAVGARGPHWISLVIILVTLCTLWARYLILSRRAYKAAMEGSEQRIEERALISAKRVSDHITALGGEDLG